MLATSHLVYNQQYFIELLGLDGKQPHFELISLNQNLHERCIRTKMASSGYIETWASCVPEVLYKLLFLCFFDPDP